MKWYFAINQNGLAHHHDMIVAAVRSARRNTALEPHLLFDAEDEAFAALMQAEGVTIHRVALPYKAQVTEWAAKYGFSPDIATGAFLRTLIPSLETSEEVVLYTDVDVLFTEHFAPPAEKPRFISCAVEFDEADRSYFNTGVMFMNIPALRAIDADFQQFFVGRELNFPNYDQSVYNEYFSGRWDYLAPEYNWKPYWGERADARIIHFHGPKIRAIRKLIGTETGNPPPPVYVDLFNRSPDAYRHYAGMLEALL